MTLLACLFASMQPGLAQEEFAPRELHPWAKLSPGSWKRVRVATETLDKYGAITGVSMSETTTTLAAMDQSSYTLCVETTIEVAGKRVSAQPRYTTYGFHGELPGQTVTDKKTENAELVICGTKVSAEIREITLSGPDFKRFTKIYYSDRVPPYVLKRSTKATDSEGKIVRYETEVEVVAVDMPYKVLSEVKSTSYVKSVQRQPHGPSTVILEIQCLDVPGGVVYQTTKKLDPAGGVTERKTLEMVDYEVVRSDDNLRTGRRRILPRARARGN